MIFKMFFSYGDCVSQSVTLYSSWMAESDPDTNNPIDPELKSTVYCTALGEGGQV